ncbi:hypothetical protein SAMN05444358_1011704 [Ruegeria halocynthiae]|uniref:Uncharacterized protein n=1 Tax=Ruegeria halocynthiae TaxID=985054 RepID=A0A1H2W863_9RHOB|nr:hypothetical protein [Ruegeria halocynthiae]SDW76731.1 hypothetical protein SAMN05444358_1011704 [Ruegeria halocynthiae]
MSKAEAKKILKSFKESDQKKIKSAKKLVSVSASVAVKKLKDPSAVEFAEIIAGMKKNGEDMLRIAGVLEEMKQIGAKMPDRWWTGLVMAVDQLLHTQRLDRLPSGVNVGVGFDTQLEVTQKLLINAHSKEPTLFRHGMNFAAVHHIDEIGQTEIGVLNKDQFQTAVQQCVRFYDVTGDGDDFATHAPPEAIKHLFNTNIRDLPYLASLIRVPIYGADKTLINKRGYNANGWVYYQPPNDLNIRALPDRVGRGALSKARRLIVEELMGDFPFDGWTRAEIVSAACYGSTTNPPPPSLLNAIGFLLEQFARPMIDGPLPVSLFHKPSPRTGATMLVNAVQLVVSGVSGTQTLPDSEEERDKRATAILMSGTAINLFDNVSGEISGGTLAKFWTDRVYVGRTLGKSEMRALPVTCSHALTGNNPSFSRELSERIGRIRLDARCADPGARNGFRHPELLAWVSENRGELVWAALVLIQNWIEKGCPEPVTPTSWRGGPDVASIPDAIHWGGYEAYVKVIGGIIGAAARNWTTWQANRKTEVVESGEDDAIQEVLSAWWSEASDVRGNSLDEKHGMYVRDIGDSPNTKPGLLSVVQAYNIYLPIKRIDRDDPTSYDPAAFGKWLAGYKDRIFKLDDEVGIEVELSRADARTRHGYKWSMQQVNAVAPDSENKVSADVIDIEAKRA